MSTFKFTLITPDKSVFSGNAKKFKSTSLSGQFEILPNHGRFITVTKPGMTEFVDENDKVYKLFTSTGVVEFGNNELTFCCDAAELPEDIDIERAEEAKERAEKRIEAKDGVDITRAQIALTRALARIDVSSKLK
ncbi:ATP synthase F1 subunit epsilon [Inconstantimicrobium mannanitabidum]|uniref:ATP synthase epsilon chain n=1 Tax=Inconstantimicrobium mannanitabidum TaxID=1604901 RepID=A0ACB5R7G3_9CLOT|nr:ATP synthase F1 subunit epsilon [Clostridium sp. TW13]GKX64948.1 ATP synthase epsilon chain [Clostridium sp. TW13]